VDGTTAKITGDLTLMGVTRPVVLDAKFYGAGDNPRNKRLNVGFTATARIKRSDFGLNYGPSVGDEIDLKIHAAFEKLP
jgi:polyisoprenoid-binding protein YceI